MRYRTLLFDLDGTLLDTLSDLAVAVNHALEAHGYPPHPEAAVVRMVGNGVMSLVTRALPKGQENPDFASVFADFRAYYEVHKADTTAPYDGIPLLLARLTAAGCRVGIVSNKPDAAVKALAARFFPDTVRVALGERPGVARKPAPDSVLFALAELGDTAEGAAYIGDSEVDIETAQRAGLPCLSVGWGFRTAEELREKGASHVFLTPGELCEYLLES